MQSNHLKKAHDIALLRIKAQETFIEKRKQEIASLHGGLADANRQKRRCEHSLAVEIEENKLLRQELNGIVKSFNRSRSSVSEILCQF